MARDIAETLGDTNIVLIANAIKEEHIALPYERVGFVCPAYFGSLPPIIGRFVAKLDFSKPPPYVFAVITAGAIHGGAMKSMAGLIVRGMACHTPTLSAEESQKENGANCPNHKRKAFHPYQSKKRQDFKAVNRQNTRL